MTTAQVVETTVTVNNNSSPIQDYVHPAKGVLNTNEHQEMWAAKTVF